METFVQITNSLNYFRKKAASYMFDLVLNTSLSRSVEKPQGGF